MKIEFIIVIYTTHNIKPRMNWATTSEGASGDSRKVCVKFVAPNKLYACGRICSQFVSQSIEHIDKYKVALDDLVYKIVDIVLNIDSITDMVQIIKAGKITYILNIYDLFDDADPYMFRAKIKRDQSAFRSFVNQIKYRVYISNPINIYLTSRGGSLLEGFKFFDFLKNCECVVHSYCLGYCASAATLPLLAADERFMYKNSFIMIHQLSGKLSGKFDDLMLDIKNKEFFMEKIKDIYIENSNISEENIDVLLKHDDWWDIDRCIENGLNINLA